MNSTCEQTCPEVGFIFLVNFPAWLNGAFIGFLKVKGLTVKNTYS